MTGIEFKNIAPSIPHQPGIYKYYNDAGSIIYIGKAKDLRKRVSSYFLKNWQGYKTHELVQRIHRIEFTIVNSEQDAFFLENALIKAHQPKYNIDLKDDKTYPYIVIKNEPFPRVFLTRKKINDGSEYVGPFTSVGRVRELLQFCKQHIQLRSCRLPLTDKNIQAKKFKVCLEYHLGNCKGPCAGLQTAAAYAEDIYRLKQLLKGKLSEVEQHYKLQMQAHAAAMEFEKAQMVKKRLEHLQHYQSKSIIVSHTLTDLDVFSIMKEGNAAYINFLMVRNGTIVQTHTQQLHPQIEETDEEILAFGITHIREAFSSDAREIVVPFSIDYPAQGVLLTIPKAGEKKKLIELSLKNVAIYSAELQRKSSLNLTTKTEGQLLGILESLQNLLKLPEIPLHIECFDNSNFQGSFPVSAMVCFKNGMPAKSDYRKFNVKTVEGINDFATMKEAVGRRYKSLATAAAPLPQLVIIDGGKGQLNAALEALEAIGLSGQMTVIGLAKNVEEIFFPGDQDSIKLNWNSEALKLLRRIRDEVHRFGITFHRQKRSKGTFKNELESISGIGPNTATQLLRHFKSVTKVKAATEQELASIIGAAKAKLIKQHFGKTLVKGHKKTDA